MTDQATPEGGSTPSFTGTLTGSSPPDGATVTGKPAKAAESQPAATDPGETKKPEPDGRDIRIKELTRRLRQQERANARLTQQWDERDRQAQPPPQQPSGRKTLADFKYDNAAYSEYERSEAKTEAVQAAREEAARARAEELAAIRGERFQERIAKFAETHADFDEVVYEGKWPCPPPMAEAIEDADEGPAIAYHLAQNPNVAAQIARLTPIQIGREIQKLEDRLIAERKKAAEPQVSKAPPPPPKIDASDPGSVDRSPLQMSHEELSKMSQTAYNKWRAKSRARNR